MTWRVAKSLLVLRDEIDAAYPGRAKGADGTIGDAAHQAEGSASDHNPWVKDSTGVGVVRALDVTHDPAHGCDTYAMAERMRLAKDGRLANGGYIISNRRITGPVHGWQWVAYGGSDPHAGHMHVSVSREQALYDDESPWVGVTEENDVAGFDKDDAHFLLTFKGLPADTPTESLGTAVLQAQNHAASADTKLDTVLAKLNATPTPGPGTPPVLSDADVQRIAAATADLLYARLKA